MMRVCHLDTCPVGVATQNPELRKRFTGKPEFVVNFFEFIAEEVREYLAALGFRSIAEAVGHAEVLDTRAAVDHWKAHGLDLTPILTVAENPYEGQDLLLHEGAGPRPRPRARPGAHRAWPRPRSSDGERVEIELPIRNVNRTVGTMLGSAVTRTWGGDGLPDDTITVHLRGSAGQSFGAFVPAGITLRLEGDANDYFGKGLSGGVVICHPRPRRAVRRRGEHHRRQRRARTARPAARRTSAAWSASASACATPAPPRSSRASATTAAST